MRNLEFNALAQDIAAAVELALERDVPLPDAFVIAVGTLASMLHGSCPEEHLEHMIEQLVECLGAVARGDGVEVNGVSMSFHGVPTQRMN